MKSLPQFAASAASLLRGRPRAGLAPRAPHACVLEALEDRCLPAPFATQTAFNDAAGIHADPTPGSPFAPGPVAGGGGAEPGWAGPWFGAGDVQNAVVFEGDQAVQIGNPA